MDLYYYEDPDITIRSGGTSKASRWAEEWAIVRGVDWVTRFEYWAKADMSTEFWLKCHADLLIDTDQALLFWDDICQDTPVIFDIAKNMQVPLVTVICKQNSTDFRII